MIDLHIRTNDVESLISICPFLYGEDNWITSGDGFAFDPIGTVIQEPGIYDEEGNQLTPPIIDERFHANLRCTKEIADQVPESIRVIPDHPVRVWL